MTARKSSVGCDLADGKPASVSRESSKAKNGSSGGSGGEESKEETRKPSTSGKSRSEFPAAPPPSADSVREKCTDMIRTSLTIRKAFSPPSRIQQQQKNVVRAQHGGSKGMISLVRQDPPSDG